MRLMKKRRIVTKMAIRARTASFDHSFLSSSLFSWISWMMIGRLLAWGTNERRRRSGMSGSAMMECVRLPLATMRDHVISLEM
jgi:hypothetical protein